MTIELKNTNEISNDNGVKIVVYGQSGSGKTTLIKTLPTPLILSAEAGLLSISDCKIKFIEIKSMADLSEAYLWIINSVEAKQFESIAIDSISEIAEVILNFELKRNKDGRAAYGEMQKSMQELIRSFRDLNKNVYMTAKMEKSQDEMSRMHYCPSMPGAKFKENFPHFFDEVLALRVEKDNEGNIQRFLMCKPDGLWSAKDRSGKLEMWEEPDLGKIIHKCLSF